MKIRFMRISCWILKATNTRSEYVIHFAFKLQQWLHKCVLMLLYKYIDCLVMVSLFVVVVDSSYRRCSKDTLLLFG